MEFSAATRLENIKTFKEKEFDLVIIGGGIIGLSIALELRLLGAKVRVLSADFKAAAGHAGCGDGEK